MSLMQLDLEENLNILLRRYAIEYKKGSREKATIFILKNFLNELYKIDKQK